MTIEQTSAWPIMNFKTGKNSDLLSGVEEFQPKALD